MDSLTNLARQMVYWLLVGPKMCFHTGDVQAHPSVILGHIYLPSSLLGSCSTCCQCETSQVAILTF